MKDFKAIITTSFALLLSVCASSQTTSKKIYDEEINPLEQIDNALIQAKENGKHVA